MYFLGFHNHELNNIYDNIIAFIMDKILNYFISIGIVDKSKNPKIFDLRS